MNVKQIIREQKNKLMWILLFSILLGAIIVFQAYLIVEFIHTIFLETNHSNLFVTLLSLLFILPLVAHFLFISLVQSV